MNTDSEFTLAELETLAKAYLDCRLTLLEEKELAFLLTGSPLDSPLLSEVRLSMGIELAMTPDAAHKEVATPRKRRIFPISRRILRSGSVAAGIILLLGIGWSVMRHPDTAGSQIEVVVDGRALSGDRAESYADRMQAQHMEMMYAMLADAEQGMVDNMRLLDELLPPR